MNLLTNSELKPTKKTIDQPKNGSIKNFFPSLKIEVKNEQAELLSLNSGLINETIKEEKSEIEKSKLSVFLLGSKE